MLLLVCLAGIFCVILTCGSHIMQAVTNSTNTLDIVVRVLRLRRNTHRSKLPVLTDYFPVLAKGILGKGGLVVAPPRGLPNWANELFYKAGTGGTDLQLIGSSVAN